MKHLARIDSGYFVAGIVFDGKKAIQSAPVISWAKGKSGKFIKDWCDKKGHKIEIVSSWE